MIAYTKIIENFVGPKALFDQNFIPPKLLYREKETKSLYSLLNDALSDGFSLNVLYQGIQGIGKKVIINKAIRNLHESNSRDPQIHKITINCREKSLEEIIISILTEISAIQKLNFGYKVILNSNISDLWNIFKLISKKYQGNLIILFNNIEDIKPELIRKLIQYGKEINTIFISTINKVIKPSTLDILSEFDLKKKLNYYSFKELFDILKQRVKLTFSHEIDRNLLEFISDLIFEQYAPVPGKGIDVLKELYPLLNQKTKLNNNEIIGIIQNQFDTPHLVDEFNILSFFSEVDLLYIIFLDNLSHYFLKSNKYYITLDELFNIYEISCESVDYKKNKGEFTNIITTLTNIGILNISKKKPTNLPNLSSNPLVNAKNFFITITPEQLKAVVDSIFN
jgi:Cdc6-like AAA superfamily ATPase